LVWRDSSPSGNRRRRDEETGQQTVSGGAVSVIVGSMYSTAFAQRTILEVAYE
jgi:hypothetical protein